MKLDVSSWRSLLVLLNAMIPTPPDRALPLVGLIWSDSAAMLPMPAGSCLRLALEQIAGCLDCNFVVQNAEL